MPYQGGSIQLGPWTEGVVYNRPPEDVAANELSGMRNCRINAAGAVEKRKGFASFNDQSAISGTPTVTGAHEYDYTSSASHTVITAGDKIFYYNSGWTDITGSVTITAQTAGDDNTFSFVTTGEKSSNNNRMVATNGVNPPIVWNASDASVSVLGLDSRFTTAQHIAWWDNRLWCANTDADDNRIWRSNILDIETWGATDFYNVGSAITAIVPTQSYLAIHTEDGIHTLTPTGNTSIPFQLQQTSQAGTISSRACITLPNERQVFVRPDGVYMWAGSEEINKISYALDDGYWPNLNASRLKKTHAVYYPSVNEVWFFVPKGSASKMNQCIIYNERFNIWFGPYDNFERCCSALINEEPHAGGYNGKLYDMVSAGYNDDGNQPIEANFTTGAPAPSGSDVSLRWLYGRTFFDAVGNYNVLVTQESGGLTASANLINLEDAGFELDVDSLNQGKLGTLRMISADTDLSGYDSQCTLNYNNGVVDQHFRIRRSTMVYRPIGRMRRAKSGVS